MMCVCLLMRQLACQAARRNTYIWKATICALAHLGLVCVDEDSWMTKWSTSTITGDRFGAHPSDGLFVNQVDGCIWSWLYVMLEHFCA
jgi:hypothetical protein